MRAVLRVIIRWVNEEAAERLARAIETLREASRDMPWRDDLREAIGDAEYAADHLTVQVVSVESAAHPQHEQEDRDGDEEGEEAADGLE